MEKISYEMAQNTYTYSFTDYEKNSDARYKRELQTLNEEIHR